MRGLTVRPQDDLVLACFLRLDISKLGEQKVTELVNKLDETLATFAPGAVDPRSIYMLTAKNYIAAERSVDRLALPFHAYVVNSLGETCDKEDCEDHPKEKSNVVNLFGKK